LNPPHDAWDRPSCRCSLPVGFGVVGDRDRFLLGVVRDAVQHEAKNLLPGERHLVPHIHDLGRRGGCPVVIKLSDAIETITTHYIERAFVESHGRRGGHYQAH
jgi:hypothetical protein